MGLGVQSGWPDPTNPTWVPGGSDFLKLFNNDKRLAVRPAGKWVRYDTTLVSDYPTWHNCQVSSTTYEVDAESGHFVGTITGVADTFTIPTTGLYDLYVQERFQGAVNGNHGLRVVNASTQVTFDDAYSEMAIIPLHVQVHRLFVPGVYLTSGTTVNFQHRYNGFGDVTPLPLQTGAPTPTITIRMVAEHDLHA